MNCVLDFAMQSWSPVGMPGSCPDLDPDSSSIFGATIPEL
jgi:hypothetical protein